MYSISRLPKASTGVMAVPKGRELVSRLTWLLWQDHERYKFQLEEAVSLFSYLPYFLILNSPGYVPEYVSHTPYPSHT